MRSCVHAIPLLLAFAMIAGLAGVCAAETTPDDVQVVDKKKVYFGDPDNFSRPAVISAKKIFDEIPAYKQIKEEGLDKNDPRYWTLLEKANKVFKRVVKKVAENGGYDLVAEVGSLKGAEEFPNLTAECIELVESGDAID
ncbi:MAG: hypothetical protein RL885_04045 [Planctomycetota bacterium]